MNASSKVHMGVGAMVVVLGALIVTPAASIAAQGGSPKPAALCKFVASAKDGNDTEAVNFDTSQAKASLGALRKAAKLSLPGGLGGAIQQLIPLYELLARGGNSAAFTKLDDYATKHCRYKNAQDIDACGLVSAEEATTLIGVPMTQYSSQGTRCSYSANPDGTTPIVEVYVGDGAKQILETNRKLAEANAAPGGPPAEVPPVPGLGDEAYQGADGVLVFQKGGIWVAINVIASTKDQQALEELARNVLTKL